MACSVPEISMFEGFEFSEANNILLMTLMEETQEDDHDHEYYGDDRLMSMIQSLEAEISSSSADPLLAHPIRYEEVGVGQVKGQDCSTSSVSTEDVYNCVDMEVASANSSSSTFDEEMMNAWSPCAAAGNDSDYSEFYYGVLLEQQLWETYLPQEPSDVVF